MTNALGHRRHHHGNGLATDAVAWGLSVLVVLPALLFGAVLPTPQAVVFGFTAVLFAWAAATRALPRAPLPAVAFVFVAPAVWAAVQGLPLGEDVVLALQGPGADRAAEGFRVAGVADPWWSLSLEPPATWVQAARSLSYAAVFVLAWAVTIRGRGRMILHAIAFLGLAEVCIGVFHALTTPEGLSVVYPGPLARRPGFHVTLLNDNHAAGLFALSAFVWLALAVEQGGTRARAVLAAGAAVMGLAVFATLSRGGAAALTTIAILFGGGSLIRRRWGRGVWARPVAWVALVVILAINAYIWLALFEYALMKYGHTSLEPSDFAGKVRIWKAAWALIADHPWFGVGAGAFASAVSPYAGIPGVTVDRAENAVLQAMADHGVPFGAGLVAVLVVLVARRLVQCRDWTAGLCVGAGLLAVSLQNLADFGLEVAGLAVPAVAALGYLFGHPSGARHGDTEPPPAPAGRTRFLAPAAVLIATSAFGAWALDLGTLPSRDRLREVVRDLGAGLPIPPGTADAALAAEARLHPLDAHLFSLAAQAAALQGRDERALALADHALVLAPDDLGTLRVCLRALTRAGRSDEAVQTMRRLFAAYPKLYRDLHRDLQSLRWPAALQVAVFEGDREGLESYLDFLKRAGDLAGFEQALRAVLKGRPDDPVALGRLGWLFLATGNRGAASDAAWRLIATHPDRDAGYDLAGRVLFAEGRLVEALALFREAASRAKDPTEARLWVLACLVGLKDWDAFDSLAREVQATAIEDRALAGRFARILADAEHRRGRVREALRILERAWNRDPTDVENLAMRARILRAERRDREALEAYRRALRLDPKNEALRREADEVEKRGQSEGDGSGARR